MGVYEHAEPLLSDQRVSRIRDRLMLRFLELPYDTMFVTAVIEPPYKTSKGVETEWPAAEMIVLCNHPRPTQKKWGMKLAKKATMYKAAWDASEKERSHFVSGGEEDPAYRIFAGLAWSLVGNLRDFRQMIN